MYRSLILFVVLLCGCSHAASQREQQLQDTLTKVKLLTDFKPLKQADAYTFLNDYYLPRLDTLPAKRKIFIHPLIGPDFKKRFEDTKAELEVRFSVDSNRVKSYRPVLYPPVSILFNKSFKWDSSKLKNTKVIDDTIFLKLIQNYQHRSIEEIEAWHKTFGYGYMCISYPIYNEHTKKLTISEWIEDGGTCGTGRDHQFWFKRVGTSWIALNRY